MERQQESHKITTTATATKSRDEQKLSQPPFTNNFCFFRLFGVFNGNETHKTWPTSRPTIKIQTHTHTHTQAWAKCWPGPESRCLPTPANGTGNFKREQLKIATFVSPRCCLWSFDNTYLLDAVTLAPNSFPLTSRSCL